MKTKDLEDVVQELTESFTNGNISHVMNALEGYSKFEAMLLAIRIRDSLQTLSSKTSFERALSVRT